MARAILLAVCLCWMAAVVSGRFLLEENEVVSSAASPSSVDCSRVHSACSTCRNQRRPGTKKTEMVCSACKPGWKLRKDGHSKTCDCNAGFAMDANNQCSSCPMGKFCPGGDPKTNPSNLALDCASGLATKFTGAKSDAQCFTMAGYGRKSVKAANGRVSYAGVACPVGTFNIGGNTAECQRCSPGLTTVDVASNSSLACVAPAGSYMDKSIGKKCPKGTYTTDFNTAAFCTPCNDGVTTEGEGSTSPMLCNRAIKGYSFVSADLSASPCPLDTYNDNETVLPYCTDCPCGWKTKEAGADGLALCLAPPGFELKPAATEISECQVGWFKADWNRNDCVKCGVNLDTDGTGAVSKDACRIPAGYGLVTLTPVAVAQLCVQNSFGDDQPRAVSMSARCVSCPANMMTTDVLTGVAATSGYTSESDCLLQAGWGTTQSNLIEECQPGTWNAGGNRLPCKQCDSGYTTLGTGSTKATDCVVQPGWELDTVLNLPKPCDKGSFSTGGTATNRFAVCQACPAGFTTQVDQSTSADDCALCEAGRGGNTCDLCTYGTWSFGQVPPSDGCSPCASGSTSSLGAGSPEECFAVLDAPNRDIFHLADDSAWVDDQTSTNAESCMASCKYDDTCFQVRFNPDTRVCNLLKQDPAGTALFGYKVGKGVEYAFYSIPEAMVIGVQVGSVSSGRTQLQCMRTCNGIGDCEAVRFVPATGSCTLLTSELDSDWVGMVHVVGSKLYSGN